MTMKAVIRIRTLTKDGQFSEVILGQLSINPNVRQQFLVPRDTYFKADLEVGTFKNYRRRFVYQVLPL